ncbi:hypothetical protein GCM10023084_74910 [Streptomyces lacrimifluminis]|uniref:Uncharacterized protein n=1 Tax=Streptomyces lacrimifluminis TaxID=1500077 RepID=A0A917P7M1_9ACTN|nr:hypothetical protein GCM10012282_72990 [Streptomyces lacrimifluminis]
MNQSAGLRAGGQLAPLVVEFGIEMPERQYDEVGEQRPGVPFQPPLLAPLARPADPQGAPDVVLDTDAGRQNGQAPRTWTTAERWPARRSTSRTPSPRCSASS